MLVAAGAMRLAAAGTILESLGVRVVAPAVRQKIQGAKTEQAVEFFLSHARVAGEVFAIRIAEKLVAVLHADPYVVLCGGVKFRKRKALVTTDTEDAAMAAPASMGDTEGPPKAASAPAATGMSTMLYANAQNRF